MEDSDRHSIILWTERAMVAGHMHEPPSAKPNRWPEVETATESRGQMSELRTKKSLMNGSKILISAAGHATGSNCSIFLLVFHHYQ